jgi:hypothetical protein
LTNFRYLPVLFLAFPLCQLGLIDVTPRHSETSRSSRRSCILFSFQCPVFGADRDSTDSQDKRYLTPIVKQVEKENYERENWDNAIVERKK